MSSEPLLRLMCAGFSLSAKKRSVLTCRRGLSTRNLSSGHQSGSAALNSLGHGVASCMYLSRPKSNKMVFVKLLVLLNVLGLCSIQSLLSL